MATTLTIPNTFTAFSKIRSADVNANFTAIASRLNWAGGTDATTGLSETNIQSNTVSGGGLTRATKLKAGTANYVVINDSSGNMSEEQYLSTTRGGLGANLTPAGSGDATKVVAVNASGNGFQLQAVPQSPGGNIYNYYQFS